MKLDELEQEYRRFHDENMGIAKAHPGIILKQHEGFELGVVAIFSLVDVDRRATLEATKMKQAEQGIKK